MIDGNEKLISIRDVIKRIDELESIRDKYDSWLRKEDNDPKWSENDPGDLMKKGRRNLKNFWSYKGLQLRGRTGRDID